MKSADGRQKAAELCRFDQISSQHKARNQFANVDSKHINNAADNERKMPNKKQLYKEQRQKQTPVTQCFFYIP